MIGYVTVGTNDLPRAAGFYDQLLGSIGGQRVFEESNCIGWSFGPAGAAFAVITPFNKEAATVGNGVMVAFSVDEKRKVDSLYKFALSLGGTDEGAPGQRSPRFYAAYFRDLDGNKLEAYYMD